MISTKEKASWLQYTLDQVADGMFSEFGYDTLTTDEKKQVLEHIIEEGWITIED